MVTDELTAPPQPAAHASLQSEAASLGLKTLSVVEPPSSLAGNAEESEDLAHIPQEEEAPQISNDMSVAAVDVKEDKNLPSTTDSTKAAALGVSPAPIPPISVSGFDPRYNRSYEIDILYYQPDTYLVTNKPWDVRIDGNTSKCPTVESLLSAQFPEHQKLYLLHQLDYVTSGVHVWGLNSAATGAAGKLFASRDVRKTYTALVKGHIEQDSFVINRALVDNPNDPQKRVYVASDEQPGKECETHVEVLRRGYFHHAPVTHVKLSPVTGRRHQLRVHMQSIGHPIVGDYAYEDPVTEHAFRTMLHAWKLELPLDKEAPLRFEAPEPFADFVRDAPMDRPDLPKRAAHVDYEDSPEPNVVDTTVERTQVSDETTEEATPLIMDMDEAAEKTAKFAGVPVPEYAFENELAAVQTEVVEPKDKKSDAAQSDLLNALVPSNSEEENLASANQSIDKEPLILTVQEVQASTDQPSDEQIPELANLPPYSGEENATAVASDFVDRATTEVRELAASTQTEEPAVVASAVPSVILGLEDQVLARDITVATDQPAVSADMQEAQPSSPKAGIVLDLQEVANNSTGEVADLPRFTLEDEVEAVQSDLDPSDVPSAADIEEPHVFAEQEGEVQPHAAHEAVMPHVVTVQGVENDVDAIGEYGIENEVQAVSSDYEAEKEAAAAAAPHVEASEHDQDTVSSQREEVEEHARSQIFAVSDIKDGQTTEFLAIHVPTETPAYSLEEEVSPVCADFADAKPVASLTPEIHGEETAVHPEAAVDQQSTIDEHLQLSYDYEQKWLDDTTLAKSAATAVEEAATNLIHRAQDTVASTERSVEPVVKETAADLGDKTKDAVTAVQDKAAEMVESAKAVVATVTGTDAPFDAQAAQKTIDEHLKLSYDYEESWNVPREGNTEEHSLPETLQTEEDTTTASVNGEPAGSAVQERARDAAISVKDKAVEMLQSAQAAVAAVVEPETPFDAEEAQKTIDDHLKLSYAYEDSWNAPQDRSLPDTFQTAEETVKSVDAKPFGSVVKDTAADLGEKAEGAAIAVKDKAIELAESAQAAVAAVVESETPLNEEAKQETVERDIKDRPVTPEPVTVEAGDRAVTPEPVPAQAASVPAPGSVTPAKRSSEQVFEEPAVVPAKRGPDEAIPSTQIPSKKLATAEAVADDKRDLMQDDAVEATPVAKLLFGDEPVIDRLAEMVTKPVLDIVHGAEETFKAAPAAEPVHQDAARSVEPAVDVSEEPEVTRASEEKQEEQSITPAVIVPHVLEPADSEAAPTVPTEAGLDAAAITEEVAEPHITALEPIQEETAHVVEPAVEEPASVIEPAVDAAAVVSELAAPVHDENVRAIEPEVDAPASVAEVVTDVAPVSEEGEVSEPAAPVSEIQEPVHDEATRSITPAVEEPATATVPTTDAAPVAVEATLESEVSEPVAPGVEEAAPVLQIPESVPEEATRAIESAVDEIATSAVPVPVVEDAPEEAARSIEPVINETVSVTEPAISVAPVFNDTALASTISELHHENSTGLTEPAVDESLSDAAQQAKLPAEDVSAVAESLHGEDARSTEAVTVDALTSGSVAEPAHEEATTSTEPVSEETKPAERGDEAPSVTAPVAEESTREHQQMTQPEDQIAEGHEEAPVETLPVETGKEADADVTKVRRDHAILMRPGIPDEDLADVSQQEQNTEVAQPESPAAEVPAEIETLAAKPDEEVVAENDVKDQLAQAAASSTASTPEASSADELVDREVLPDAEVSPTTTAAHEEASPSAPTVSEQPIQAPAMAHAGVESPIEHTPVVAAPIARDVVAEEPAPATSAPVPESAATTKAQRGWCAIM
ncbi:RNA pseudouridylate synthase domain-containing protein 1 [Geranomyces michiganensis]|nr:RNA pseudouridylate synthase domain-containing protein 1 [Geranomyces michiganensis]